MENHNVSSVNDLPKSNKKSDELGMDIYAEALSEFIMESSTPLTIGMQGEWGTGKTSLMYMIKELLVKQNIATSWVNTWEFAMFNTAAEITPSVLNGLLDNMVKTCKEEGYWKNEQRFNEVKDQVSKGLSIIGKFAVNAALKKTTGFSLDEAGVTDQSTKSKLISQIAEIKERIKEIINLVIEDPENPVKKVVFFVDDLDRIEPSTAVEILEALKNVFDIEQCVFILAIDYDIVIKGLESKFGPKTDKNEREFRSFFDKIIQLPFSMPVSSYKIDKLIKAKFEELNLTIHKEFETDYFKIVQLTSGFVPRSIKRFINSYSLIRKIRSLEPDYTEDHESDFCLFTVIGIQISYPQIFRLISKDFDYTAWDKNFANQNGVDEIIKPVIENEFTDDPWEQFIWSFCQKDPYLKAKAYSIIQVMNILAEKLGENLLDNLEQSMAFASITTVDDNQEMKESKPYQHVLLNNLDEYFDNPKNGFSSRDYDHVKQLMMIVEDDIKNELKELKIKYSPSMGLTFYSSSNGKERKCGGMEVKNKKEVLITLYRDNKNDYRLPLLNGFSGVAKKMNKLKNLGWYHLVIGDEELYKMNKSDILYLFRVSAEMAVEHSDKILNIKMINPKKEIDKYFDPEYTYDISQSKYELK